MLMKPLDREAVQALLQLAEESIKAQDAPRYRRMHLVFESNPSQIAELAAWALEADAEIEVKDARWEALRRQLVFFTASHLLNAVQIAAFREVLTEMDRLTKTGPLPSW